MVSETAYIYSGNTLQKRGEVDKVWRHEDGVVSILFKDGEEWETSFVNVHIVKK